MVYLPIQDLKEMVVVTTPLGNQPCYFPKQKWRQAFNRYFDEVLARSSYWSPSALVIMTIPLIHGSDGRHYTIGDPIEGPSLPRPKFHPTEIHTVKCDKDAVDLALARFVRNDYIKMLVIELAYHQLFMWKGPRRTDLFATLARVA
jgi:hypothetical protein